MSGDRDDGYAIEHGVMNERAKQKSINRASAGDRPRRWTAEPTSATLGVRRAPAASLNGPRRVTARTALVLWGVAVIFLIVLVVLHVAAQALLLTFAGVLFGTAFRGLAEWLSAKSGWRVSTSLAACAAVLVALLLVAALWILPHVSNQAARLADSLTQAYESLRQSASETRLGARLLGESTTVGRQIGSFAARAAGILGSAVGAIGGAVFVLFVALYTAGNPEVYRRGFVRLVPPTYRDRASEVLDALASTLRRWLLGRIISMTAVGVGTGIGLWIIGVPLPVTLALIAGSLGFVPNIGPVVSAVPAVLLAITIDATHAVYVLILYLAINLADGYGLTPWVQKRAVSVPPALILTSQVVFGALWGVLGVTLATPTLACLLVMTRKLYVELVLERQEPVPSNGNG
jgi:predicted PurR-regulated permease PerM